MPVSADIRHAVEEVPGAPVAHWDTGWDLKEYIIIDECVGSNENHGQSHQLLSSPFLRRWIFWFGACAGFQVWTYCLPVCCQAWMSPFRDEFTLLGDFDGAFSGVALHDFIWHPNELLVKSHCRTMWSEVQVKRKPEWASHLHKNGAQFVIC